MPDVSSHPDGTISDIGAPLKERAGWWLLYGILLMIVALPQGMHTVLTPHYPCTEAELAVDQRCKPQALTPAATNTDIIRVMEGTDAAFIARRVRDNAETHDRGHMSLWPLWPPGMLVIETAFYLVLPSLPVGLCLMLLEAAAWAAVCVQLAAMLPRRAVHPGLRFIFPLVLLLYGLFPYLFQLGVFYSESLSIAFFLLGAGTLLRSARQRRYAVTVYSGLWFAASAYMRAQTDVIMTVALAGGIAAWIISRCVRGWKNPLLPYRCVFLLCATALATYQAATFPYRAAHDMHWISFTGNPLWHAVWMEPDSLTPDLKFYADGGALAGCRVDPVECARIHLHDTAHTSPAYAPEDYFRFTVMSFIRHPLAWLQFKLPFLFAFWMDGTAEGLLATLLSAGLAVIIWRRPEEVNIVLGILLTATGIGVVGPFLLMHIEERYLYQFKLLILYAGGVAFACHVSRRLSPAR